jgi:hypothetical protein
MTDDTCSWSRVEAKDSPTHSTKAELLPMTARETARQIGGQSTVSIRTAPPGKIAETVNFCAWQARSFHFWRKCSEDCRRKRRAEEPMRSPKVLLKVAASESCFLKVAKFQKFLKVAF